MLTLTLPLPPSANALFKNLPQGGRAKTRAYQAWREDAGYHARVAARANPASIPVAPLQVIITAALPRNRDLGNLLKPIEDLLVEAVEGLADDRWNDRILLRRDESVPAGAVQVTIAAIADTS